MAKLLLCAVQDTRVGFAAVMTFRSKGEAIRSFEEHVKDATSMPSKYPADYVLWSVGMYDDETGQIFPSLERMIGAGEFGFLDK